MTHATPADDPSLRVVTSFEALIATPFQDGVNAVCWLRVHYEALPSARPFSFGLGNLWRIAVQYPGCPVPACIHRAPEDSQGQLPRLLLIS